MAEKTLRRVAEIRLATLTHNAERGNEAARIEASKISAALTVAKDDAQLSIALRNAGVALKI